MMGGPGRTSENELIDLCVFKCPNGLEYCRSKVVGREREERGGKRERKEEGRKERLHPVIIMKKIIPQVKYTETKKGDEEYPTYIMGKWWWGRGVLWVRVRERLLHFCFFIP